MKRTRSWKWHKLFIEAFQNCRCDWYSVQNSSQQLSVRVCLEHRQRTDESFWWNIYMRHKTEQKKIKDKIESDWEKTSFPLIKFVRSIFNDKAEREYCIYINIKILLPSSLMWFHLLNNWHKSRKFCNNHFIPMLYFILILSKLLLCSVFTLKCVKWTQNWQHAY